ncbi:DDE-domain-containing protein, partial [Dacryopinax primogenitus]
MLSAWLHDEAGICEKASNATTASFKQPQTVEHPIVEAALKEWVEQAQQKGIAINENILKIKARQFADMQGIPKEKFLLLSNGWVQGVKGWLGLRGVQLQGEAASADVEKADEEELRLRKISNQKGDKTRMSYMLTTNADGSERLKPLVISHSKQPCCFQHKTPQSLGFDYHFNKKAWMTGVIFQLYITALDCQMQQQNQKILLLVDNHKWDPATVTNVQVKFLAPNMTAHIQPMDAGIIQNFKANYKQAHCEQALDQEMAGVLDIYCIEQKEAMGLAWIAWEEVTVETIANC